MLRILRLNCDPNIKINFFFSCISKSFYRNWGSTHRKEKNKSHGDMHYVTQRFALSIGFSILPYPQIFNSRCAIQTLVLVHMRLTRHKTVPILYDTEKKTLSIRSKKCKAHG